MVDALWIYPQFSREGRDCALFLHTIRKLWTHSILRQPPTGKHGAGCWKMYLRLDTIMWWLRVDSQLRKSTLPCMDRHHRLPLVQKGTWVRGIIGRCSWQAGRQSSRGRDEGAPDSVSFLHIIKLTSTAQWRGSYEGGEAKPEVLPQKLSSDVIKHRGWIINCSLLP